jgi:hypothetical protein
MLSKGSANKHVSRAARGFSNNKKDAFYAFRAERDYKQTS